MFHLLYFLEDLRIENCQEDWNSSLMVQVEVEESLSASLSNLMKEKPNLQRVAIEGNDIGELAEREEFLHLFNISQSAMMKFRDQEDFENRFDQFCHGTESKGQLEGSQQDGAYVQYLSGRLMDAEEDMDKTARENRRLKRKEEMLLEDLE